MCRAGGGGGAKTSRVKLSKINFTKHFQKVTFTNVSNRAKIAITSMKLHICVFKSLKKKICKKLSRFLLSCDPAARG